MELQMSTKTKTDAFERVHIEEGIYTATLKEVKDISEGQYGPRVAFVYEVEGKELALVCYKTKATADNKIGQTLIAHGIKIADSNIDTNNLPNKQVRAWVEDFQPTDAETKKPKGSVGSTISKVKALVEKI